MKGDALKTRGEPRGMTREKRRRLAARLDAAAARWEPSDALVDMVRDAMTEDGAELEKRGDGWRLRLLGRTASCTSSAEGAIWNWLAATRKEFAG